MHFCLKISFIIGGDGFLLPRNISIARDWIFFVWIKTESYNSSNSEVVNKTIVSLMELVYFLIICAALAHPNEGTITKLRIKKDVY